MYYNRIISDEFSKLIANGGPLRWIFEYVVSNPDLDLFIAKNKNEEWISVYRGLTRIIKIKETKKPNLVKVEADKKYKAISPELFGNKIVTDINEDSIERIRKALEDEGGKDKHYNNKKEGYYQTILSREFGICGSPDSDFVIVDKEAVIGYEDKIEKDNLLDPIQSKFKELQAKILEHNPKKFGSKLDIKSFGNELDFLAVDKEGNILLIEYKDGTNTNGIYLSPLQIGIYFELFNSLPKDELKSTIIKMVEQKQAIGLINPNWKMPILTGKIIPVLIISNPNSNSNAYDNYCEILEICRNESGLEFLKKIKTYSYTEQGKLTSWVKC